MEAFSPVVLFGILVIIIWLFNSINVLREYERGVIFRLGRLLPEPKGPGLIFVFWPFDKIVEVENYLYATSQLSQTTLRSVLGEVALDDLLSRRETLNVKLQNILDQHTDPWGIKVALVEVKQVDLPQEMQRAMAKQAEAEREKRAKIIHADGEFQAAEKLAEAAAVITKEPVAIQLRYLQTLTEIGVEKNTTVIFPVPIDIFEAFLKK